MKEQTPSSQSSKAITGMYWSIGMRWVSKLVSLVSIVVLARLLSPEDYGLVAIALVVVGSIKIFFSMGVEMSLLRDNKSTKEDFDTAWSLRLLQAVALCALLTIIAPYVSSYYQDERLVEIFYLASVSVFINGFQNIGIVLFRKQLEFKKDFTFNVVANVLGTCCTIALAFYFHSYHALLYGTIVQKIINVILSYTLIDFRPRFSLSRFHSIWSVSKWMIVKNVCTYFSKNGDYLFLGKFVSASSLGHYRWTDDINSLTSRDILQPISRVLLPTLANIQSDTKRMYSAYLKSINFITSIAVPIILGIGGIAEELIPILLGGGEKWQPVVPLLEVAVFIGFFRVLHSLSNNLLIIINKIKHTAYIDIISTAWILSMMYPAFQLFGIKGLLFTKIVASAFIMINLYFLLLKYTTIKMSQILSAIWRPCVSGLLMSGVLMNFSQFFNYPTVILLVIKICVGALTYTSMMLFLWYLSGKPNTFEQTALNKLLLFFNSNKYTTK